MGRLGRRQLEEGAITTVEPYNPIVRTFCRFRAGLLDRLEVDRHEVRPGTPLEALLPLSVRRHVWDHLRRQGLRLPALELSGRDHRRNLFRALRAAVSSAFYLQSWYALLLAFPFGLSVYFVSRRRAEHFPLGLKTVGEMVIYSTRFAEHRGSGYRWTRNEIALKVETVRSAVAEQLCDRLRRHVV